MSAGTEQLYRLLRRFEQGPEGGAALTAYLCPAGKWTIAFGCTKHEDGRPIAEGDRITEAQVYPYTVAAVARVYSDIDRMVTRKLNEYQRAALASFVFNLGGENLRVSPRLLPAINAGRWEDAADIMGDYYRAWAKKKRVDEDGVTRSKWHRAAMYGLRIRRFAEACVLLGLDWEVACDEQNIAFPRVAEWQPGWSEGVRTGGRFFDVVSPRATPFDEIHTIALAHPLPALKPEPSITIITDVPRTHVTDVLDVSSPNGEPIIAATLPQLEDELVLTIPAASDSGPDANGAELVRPDLPDVQAPKAEENTNSTGVLVGSAERLDPIAPQPPVALPSPLPPVSSAPSAPIGKPKDPPPVIAGQDGAKPKSPWTVQPEEVHYKIDPGAGLKPLEDSDRAKAFYWQRSFMFIIYLGGAGVFGSTFMAGSEVLMKHAALMSVLLDLIVPLAIAASGLLVGAVGKSWADWRRHCAQEKASQGLY